MSKTFFLPLITVAMFSANTYSQTIQEALTEAYNTNPSLQASRAYLRGVDENVAIAKSGYRPNINLEAGYLDQNSSSDNALLEQDGTQKQIVAKVSQPLFRGFQTVNAVKSAEHYVKAEENNLYNIEQSILLEGATAYLDVLRDSAILELQKNNEALLKKRLDETQQRFNVGEVTRTDVSQAKARHARASADRINAQGVLEATKANYVRVIGSAPGKLDEPLIVKTMIPQSLNEAVEYTKDNNYAIKQSKGYLNSQTYTVAQKTGALLPSVSLDAAASKINSDIGIIGDAADADNVEVGVNLTMPLYAAGKDRAEIRQSKYQKWQAQETVLVTTRQAVSDVSAAFELMTANKSQISAIVEQVAANQLALDGVQKEEALGNRTIIDVLDAYQELLNSNVEEVKAKRNYYVSGMQLLLSMGKLTAKDLALNAEYYNPQKFYNETKNKWLSTSIKER